MNNVSLIGRIAMDPKVGNGVLTSLLAVKRIYKSSDNVEANFIPLTLFGKQADNFNRLTHKGERIGVDGSIKTSTYTDDNGHTQHGWSVVINHFYLLNSKPKSDQRVANLNSEQIAALSSQLSAASKQAESDIKDSDLPF